MTQSEITIAKELSKCRTGRNNQKGWFIQQMNYRAQHGNPEIPLTDKERKYLHECLHHFRKQVPKIYNQYYEK